MKIGFGELLAINNTGTGIVAATNSMGSSNNTNLTHILVQMNGIVNRILWAGSRA
jgi:hypothetical protein